MIGRQDDVVDAADIHRMCRASSPRSRGRGRLCERPGWAGGRQPIHHVDKSLWVKKPVHYAFNGRQLLFDSEIKSILAVTPELAQVDRQGLWQYIQFGYIPDPASSFADIN